MASNHFRDGHPVMVDVSAKTPTVREAVAEAIVTLPPSVARALPVEDGPDDGAGRRANPKGDPCAVAELAGIMGAKRTADLIPLCHPLPLDAVDVRCEVEAPAGDGGRRVRIVARCRTTAATGVEMEAMTAVSVAALTLYDMLKGAAKGGAERGSGGGKAIEIGPLRLLEKRGGSTGDWRRA